MKIKRFVAPDMRQALRRVREEQGPDAVILSNSRVAEGVEIIAALDYDEALIREALGSLRAETGSAGAAAPEAQDAVAEAPGAPSGADMTPVGEEEAPAGPLAHRAPADLAERPGAQILAAAEANPSLDAVHSDIRGLRELLESQLSSLAWNDYSRRRPGRAQVLRNLSRIGVAPDVAAPIAEQLEDGDASEHAWQLPLRILAETLPMAEDRLLENGGIAAFVGPTGVGKTTTIAKLAHRARMQGKRVLIAAGDTFRAAAIEQLEVWATRVGADLFKKKEGSDPAAVAYEAIDKAVAEGFDLVLLDTAGRLHTKKNLMEELEKVKRVAAKKHPGAPHKNVLVVDATTGQNALSQTKLFDESVGVDEIILTKLDGTAKGGIVVAIALTFGLPITFVGLGEKMEDLRPFRGEDFAKALLG